MVPSITTWQRAKPTQGYAAGVWRATTFRTGLRADQQHLRQVGEARRYEPVGCEAKA